MRFFGTGKNNATALWRLPINYAANQIFKSEVATAQLHFFEGPGKVHRPRSDSLLHFDMRTCSKFVRKNKMQALGVCFPQPCSSADRMFAASRSRLDYYRRIEKNLKTQVGSKRGKG